VRFLAKGIQTKGKIMATRTAPVVFPVPLPLLFAKLVEWGVPFETDAVSDEFNTSDEFTTPALGALWDADLITNEGGVWSVVIADATPETAESVAREALADSLPVVEEAPKPLTPAQRLKARKAAAKPVKGSDGENVTAPVMAMNEDGYARPTGERREIDAAQGERVIAEGDMRTLIQELRTPAPVVPAAMEITEYESDIVKHGLALDEPDFIPAMPEILREAGISENAWYMAHAAITQTARTWWGQHIAKKLTAAQDAAPVETVPVVEPVYAVAPASAADAGF
jgi:hypothetical protein